MTSHLTSRVTGGSRPSAATAAATEPPQSVLIPMKVDAFILNPTVCSGRTTDAKIAPLSRPDYTGLRLSDKTIKSDVFPSVDLRYCAPLRRNQRITDIGNGMLRRNRCGVYLSWLLPAVYRTASMASESAVQWQKGMLQQSGYPLPANSSRADYGSLAVRPMPVRWLVVRHLIAGSSGLPTLEGWIIESDRKRSLEDLVNANSDVDIEAAPYLFGTPGDNGPSFSFDDQAGVFTGCKTQVAEWSELGDSVPRVTLNIINTGNEYLADFQPHNPNVFSMLDAFEVVDSSGNVSYLDSAQASYYVIGWHADATQDPFYIPADVKTTLGERLMACRMQLKKGDMQATADWSTRSCSTRVLCHGALYNVQFSYSDAPSMVPANQSGKFIADKMPISFGTTELDALLAYVRAHENDDQDLTAREVARNIVALQALLFAEDDGVDGQLEAEDEVHNHNFSRMSGGGVFYLSQKDQIKDEAPGLTEAQKWQLRHLNLLQEDLNLCTRTLQQLRWDLFAFWWKRVSGGAGDDLPTRVAALSSRLKQLITTIATLRQQISAECSILSSSSSKTPQLGALPDFYKPRDPTLSIGGMSSAWPYDFQENLKVRLDDQIAALSSEADNFASGIKGNLPSDLSNTISSLLSEFMYLESNDTYDTSSDSWMLPLYHDSDQNKATADLKRDQWNARQPWFPLFVEWEAEYWHIPFDRWWMENRIDSSGKTVTGYGIKRGVNLAEEEAAKDDHDRRRVSGRVSILPQVGLSLATKIRQLFQNTPASVLDSLLTPDEQQNLVERASRLQFLSFPLAGLIDHFLTRSQGTHAIPNLRFPGEMLQTIPGAIISSGGLKDEQLQLMGDQTHVTPYSNLVDLSDFKFSAFKPCTHGQLRFTKFNVIDRFGQGVHALNPDVSHDSQAPELYPCTSEFYACQPLDSDHSIPNTVLKTEKDQGCQFVQMPPQINQYARLNGYFVTKDNTMPFARPYGSYWRPCDEWESPVWGWTLVNMVNQSLQLFLGDGTFYCEVRMGGPTGSQVEPRWLPFQPSTKSQGETKQMDHLIAALQNQDYLEAFITMVQRSLDCTSLTPTTYCQSLNSSIGRPLALVYTGWSLELAVDALDSQSSLNDYDPDLLLNSSDKSNGYSFPLKLGDGERSYDGLVGYFHVRTPPAPVPGDAVVNFSTIFTYFPSESTSNSNPTTSIDSDSYDALYPFYVRPDDPATNTAVPAQILADRKNREMLTYAALMDPFTAIHGYTGILPAYALKLPNWSWRTALDRISTFIAAGPLVTVSDIPPFDRDYVLHDQSKTSLYPTKNASEGVVVPMPAGNWTWLQPYAVAGREVRDDGDDELETAFMALQVGKNDLRPRLEPGPYTAVEGYLLLQI
jgi:hypothetical protein